MKVYIQIQEIDMRRMFGFLIGIFTGSLVGAALALLLAPESGEQFRKEIRSRSGNFTGEIKSAASARRAQLEAQLASMRALRLPEENE